MTVKAMVPSLLFFHYCCCCWLSLVQSDGVSDGMLTTEELQQVFGERDTVPNYSVFTPLVVGSVEKGGRRTRSTTSTFLQFNALGRAFNFRLQPNSDLLSPYFVIIGRHGDRADIRDVDRDQLDCYYQGVDQAQGSYNTSIAVELCGPVRGVISSPTAEYVIEPLPQVVRRRRRTTVRGDLTSHTHILYTKQDNTGDTVEATGLSRRRRSFLPTLQQQQQETRALLGLRQERQSYYDSYEHVVDSRIRSEWGEGGGGGGGNNDFYDERSISDDGKVRRGEDLYIETAVFVDRDLYRHMEDNFPTDTEDQVLRVVLAMVNAVQLLYNDDSLGHRVKFVLKRLEVLYGDPPSLHRPNDIDNFLTSFCAWQRQENPPEDTHELHWDHALILTGLDVYTLTSSGRLNSQVVGLAPVAGMCTRSSSCTVNEGRHFESVYVMAHEIGHNLGMRHDGLQAGNNCDPGRYLMSPTLGSGKITWSPCSRRYLDDFLRSQQASCLRDVSAPDSQQMNHEAHSPPGQRFSADQQCMLKHGVGSHHADSQPLEDICQDLHCRRDHYTWTSHPALEGTSCGHRKWCQRGRCTENAKAPALVPSSLVSGSGEGSPAGVGGKWGVWSECRSACLYGDDGVLSSGSSGLSLSERRCGSRSCRGEYRYRLCSEVQECSKGQRRTLQDFADDTCRIRAKNSAYLTGLGAKVPPEGLTQCEVECETTGRGVEASGKSFPDGTVCQSASSLPAFCVAAVCTEFRCESNALYGADPLTCRPDVGVPDPHRPLGPSDYWKLPITTTTSTPPPSDIKNPQWGPWSPASTCRFSCLTPAKGIQLVSRKCQSWGCTGVNKNIQICSPATQDCHRLKSTFEYASEVCGRFKTEVDQLSGVGMQLASTKEDPDRSCTVACQDSVLNYRFYRVNGREGWFPFGTDCSRGSHVNTPSSSTASYCLNGKCLDFSSEGTPLRNTIYTEYERSRSLELEPIIERDFPREARPMSTRGWHSWGGRRRRELISSSSKMQRRDVSPSSHPISSTVSDHLLLYLVEQINSSMTSEEVTSERNLPGSSIDFKNPLFVDQVPVVSATPTASAGGGEHLTVTLKPKSFTLTPILPRLATNNPSSSFFFEQQQEEGEEEEEEEKEVVVTGDSETRDYRWLVYVSPCSVTCGTGLKEVVLLCVPAGSETQEAVEASLCVRDQQPPVTQGFSKCHTTRVCPTPSTHTPVNQTTVLGWWLFGLLNNIRQGGRTSSNSSGTYTSNSSNNSSSYSRNSGMFGSSEDGNS
ncbi:A disintegrin and metalloproteinase with thrombospondin motifs adt-1-like isoform X1 [Cherax quadricarinatus]